MNKYKPILGIALMSLAASASAVTIGFEDSIYTTGDIITQGFVISNQSVGAGNQQPLFAGDLSYYFGNATSNSLTGWKSLAFSKYDGTAFYLNSIDTGVIACGFACNDNTGLDSALVVGHLANGSVLSEIIQFTGVESAYDYNQNGFSTTNLGWSDLLSFDIIDLSAANLDLRMPAIDNIVIDEAPVPSPSPISLILVGLALPFMLKRKAVKNQ